MAGTKLKMKSSLAALVCAGALAAGTAAAQSEIEIRSARIHSKDPIVAAQRLAGTQATISLRETAVRPVARFPDVVLGTVSYQMSATGPSVNVPSGQIQQPAQGRIAAMDLLPAFVDGDSLLVIPENFTGDPTQAGTVDAGGISGRGTTVRFNRPIDSPFIGIAGPGSSPGIAGSGAIPTQGVVLPISQGGQATGVQAGTPSGSTRSSGSARGTLRIGGRP